MARVTLRHRDRFADASRNQGDLSHIRVHRGDREQADEAVLDSVVSGMFPDYDDVGVRAVAQKAGNRGLRQHQQVVAVGELGKDVIPEQQDAEAARGVDGGVPVVHRATLVAEQDEMPVGKPPQQRRDVRAVFAREAALGIGVDLVGESEQRSGQCPGVQRNLAGIGEHARQQSPGLGDRLGIHGTGQLDVYPRLVHALPRLVDL